MPEKNDEKTKEILKEALKEWLDAKYAALGRWALSAFLIAAFGALVYLILFSQGWRKG